MNATPLSGLRVIEFSAFVAAPSAGLALAQLFAYQVTPAQVLARCCQRQSTRLPWVQALENGTQTSALLFKICDLL